MLEQYTLINVYLFHKTTFVALFVQTRISYIYIYNYIIPKCLKFLRVLMLEISAVCFKTANISLRKYLFLRETAMNIIKFDHAH